MKRNYYRVLFVLLTVCFVFLLASCSNRYEGRCDFCDEFKPVSLRLVDGVDWQLCDSCYSDCTE